MSRNSRALTVLVLLLSACPAVAEERGPAEQAYAAGAQALRARNYEAAVAAFEQADDLQPGSEKILLHLGIARSALQDWSGAIDAYERLLRLDPTHSRALNNLGNVYFRQGRYEEATRYYGSALEADPDYLLAAFHQGRVLWQLNRAEEAERWFRHCLELPAGEDRERTTQLDCSFYLGTLRFRARDFETAATIMQRVVATHPGHAEAHYYLGMAYRGLGRMEEARQQLEQHRRLLDAMRRDAPIEKQGTP